MPPHQKRALWNVSGILAQRPGYRKGIRILGKEAHFGHIWPIGLKIVTFWATFCSSNFFALLKDDKEFPLPLDKWG